MNKKLLAVVVTSILSGQSFAEEASPSKETNVAAERKVDETIVVTGQKLSRELQDTKESVAVIRSEEIEDYAIQDLNNIYALTANTYDLGAGETFGIRGVSQNSSSTGGGSGELASLYVDGVAYTGYATRFGPKDLWDVDQVEVLRGPQSTNVGRNALIGAVVVQTKRPELGVYDGSLRLGLGNYGKRSVDAMFNAPISESVALRVSGQFAESDGFMHNATLNDDKADARKNYNVRAQLLIEPSDVWRLNLIAQYAQSGRGQDIYYVAPDKGFPIDSRTSYDDVKAHEDYDGTSLAAHLDVSLGQNWSLSSITSYINGNYDRLDDTDRLPGETGNVAKRTAKDTNWAQELRFNYNSDKLDGVLGFYYTEVKLRVDTQRRDKFGIENLGSAVPDIIHPFYPIPLNIDQDSKFSQKNRNFAFFNEWDYRVTQPLTLSAGFRYDYENLTVDETSTNISIANPEVLPDPNVVDSIVPGLGPTIGFINNMILAEQGLTVTPAQDTNFHAFLPQVGLTYDLTSDASVSAFYKRGYRSGGTELTQGRELNQYDPEHLDNYEVSARTLWLDGRLVANANAYFGDWKDQQITICPGGNQLECRTENAGNSHIYGTELALQYAVTRDLSLFGNFGWAHTKFVNYTTSDGDDLSGNRFALSPEYTSTLGGRYFITDNLYATATANYQSEMYGDVKNNPDYVIDARTLFDMSLGYFGEGFKVDAYVKNITNDFYLTGNFNKSGDKNVRAGAPREFGAYVTFFM